MGLFPKNAYEGPNWRRRHGEPKNRRQLFQCVLWDQFFSLIPVNLLYLLFWLPAIGWSMFCFLQLLTMDAQTQGQTMVALLNTWVVGLIPCLLPVAPARAGMALLMRNWAREEYTGVWSTFWKGVKDNWKGALPTSVVTALLPATLWSAYQLDQGVFFWVVCGVVALFLLAMQVFYVLLVTYDLKWRYHLKNAVLLLFLKLPTFVAVGLGNMAFVILFFLLNAIQPHKVYENLLFPVVYYCTVGLAVSELIGASLANMLCDRYFGEQTS